MLERQNSSILKENNLKQQSVPSYSMYFYRFKINTLNHSEDIEGQLSLDIPYRHIGTDNANNNNGFS